MIKARIIAVILIAFNWCAAQSYVNYSEKDGLPSNHVYQITQDLNGFIWIATDEGLVKYNGSEFKIFTTRDGLPTNDIYNIFPGKDGKLWYAAKSSSLGYIENDRVYDFKNLEEEIGINPNSPAFTGNKIIASSSITSHILNQENRWELQNYLKDENYLKQGYIIHKTYKGVAILKKNEKQLYIITHDNELIKIQDSSFILKNTYRGQLTDSLFIAISKKSYGFLNLNNLETKKYFFKDQLNIDSLKYRRIYLVNNQIQLSGENVVALLGKDLKPQKIVHIPKRFKSHFSFIDRENTIWVASFTNGIYKSPTHESLIKKELDEFKINDIKKVKDGIIALVNGKGFYKFDDATASFTPFIASESFLYDATYIEETNSSYFITKQNLYVHDNQIKMKLPNKTELMDEYVRSMAFYHGYIYGHQSAGISKVDAQNYLALNHFDLNSARCEIAFDNKLIVGATNGLYVLRNDKFESINSLAHFKKPITDLLKINEKTLLVTTAGYGSYITDLKTIQILEGSEFLKSSNPYFKHDHLYLPTNQGIYHYEYFNNSFKLKNIWNNTNGLPTNKINGVEKVNNKLLVATNQGVIHFPLDYQPEQSLLDLYIESAIYNDHDLKMDRNAVYTSNSDLQVVIKNIDYRNNQNLSYEFRLLPTQTSWVKSNSANLTFTDLTPGAYTIEVKKDSITKCFEFDVEPRWYQSWWFYVISIVGLISLVIMITKKLTKASENKKNKDALQSQKLSELQLKALRSQMNPHFVFNSLTAIQYYINENDFETSDRYLVKFSRLVREFFELSKEQHITVEREIELLKNYLDLEKLRFKSKLNYEIIVDPELDLSDKLPSMLLQPIVENAVNHGVFNKTTDGTVIVKFSKINENQIRIHIIDDGVGYQVKEQDVRYKSSSVIDDRLKYLKASGLWAIEMERSPAYEDDKNPGHEVIFDLKKIEE